MSGRFAIAIAAALGCACSVFAQQTISLRIVTAEQQIQEYCAARDYVSAAKVIDRELLRRSGDATLLYNGACVAAQLGELDLAADRLRQALRAGFRNLSHMRRDPDLKPLRQHPVFIALFDARDAADDMLAQMSARRWETQLQGKDYRSYSDPINRIRHFAALDPETLDAMRLQVDDHLHHLRSKLFGPVDTHWVTLIIAGNDRPDALSLPRHVEGVYRHERRELIAADTEASLRHELVHMLHHAHMDLLGQQHPAWIQEGLACLWEEYAVVDGAVTFRPNERDLIAQTLAADGRLLPWGEILAMNETQLKRESHRIYPQVRSMCRFIATRHDLGEWYRLYAAGFDEDPSGRKSLEEIFALPLAQIESQWLNWLRAQPVTIDRRQPRT